MAETDGSEGAAEAVALTKVDEEATVAPALVLRKNHDTRYVVFLLTVLFLERRHRGELRR